MHMAIDNWLANVRSWVIRNDLVWRIVWSIQQNWEGLYPQIELNDTDDKKMFLHDTHTLANGNWPLGTKPLHETMMAIKVPGNISIKFQWICRGLKYPYHITTPYGVINFDNIGLVNDLLPDSTKPLPDPKLNYQKYAPL